MSWPRDKDDLFPIHRKDIRKGDWLGIWPVGWHQVIGFDKEYCKKEGPTRTFCEDCPGALLLNRDRDPHCMCSAYYKDGWRDGDKLSYVMRGSKDLDTVVNLTISGLHDWGQEWWDRIISLWKEMCKKRKEEAIIRSKEAE